MPAHQRCARTCSHEGSCCGEGPISGSQGMLLMQCVRTPAVLPARREALPGELVAHSRSCPWVFMKVSQCCQCHQIYVREGILI